jgi:hypothetical protein
MSEEQAAYQAFEKFDNFAALRNGLRRLSAERGEWSGYPMPIEGAPLIVEPRYPKAEEIMAIGRKAVPPEEAAELAELAKQVRSRFWSHHLRSTIITFNDPDGKVRCGIIPGANQVPLLIDTLGAADAWGLEQEHHAVQLLGTLLRHRQFKQYLLAGMFMERSDRSGLTYLFRRLRPTIVLTPRGKDGGEELRILCALCLHPIAYYEGSWAGAMCPTDDVVAHLALMRGDEPLFWKRANQHPPYRPEAGL